MSASNYPGLRFPKTSRVLKRLDDELDERAREAAVYKAVDERDGRRCTCCGAAGNPYALTLLGKLHHDHIRELSLGGKTETKNCCLLCSRCHEYKTRHQLEPSGNPDRGTLRYRVTEDAAAVIFARRPRPAHVRVVKGVTGAARRPR